MEESKEELVGNPENGKPIPLIEWDQESKCKTISDQINF